MARTSGEKTRLALAESLRNQIKKKPLDKINISDIVADCNLNRQTFYYHFQDVYALIEWMYRYDGTEIFRKTSGTDDVFATAREMLAYVDRHREELCAVTESKAKIYFFNFLNECIGNCFNLIFDEIAKDYKVSDKYRKFLQSFCTSSIVGVVDEWVKAPASERASVDEMMKMFDYAFNGTLKLALSNYKASSNK